MPVVQRRPHIIELLNIAVGQQAQINETRSQLLMRPPIIWFDVQDPSVNYTAWELKKLRFHNSYIVFSRIGEKIHQSKAFSWARRIAWPVAFSVMAYEAPLLSNAYSVTTNVFYWLDIVVNSFFLIESLCRLTGLFIRSKIERACKREMSPFSAFIKSGILDIIIITLCFGYGLTATGLWLRLARLVLITASAIELFPQIDVLMSGLSNGVRSVFFTIVVFVLILVFYASLGHHLFRRNDPLHFRTFTDSFLTFFQMSTFDNWLNIYFLNAQGCDSYPADYGSLTFQSSQIETSFGKFMNPTCSTPYARPIMAAVVFFSFALVEGYVLVSMNLAAVAIGINEKLEVLRRAHVYGDDEEAEALSRRHVDRGGSVQALGNVQDVKAAKLLGAKNHTKELTALLHKIWDYNAPNNHVLKHSDSTESVGEYSSFLLKLKFVVLDGWYEFFIAGCIFADACVQISDELDNSGNLADPNNIPWHWLFQAAFFVDILIRVAITYPNWKALYKNSWFLFSVICTAVNFIPLSHPNSHNPLYSMVSSVRLFRLIEVLWTYRFLPDLRVIMNAFHSSYKCLIYVAVLVTLFLCYFSIGGILLFKQAAPFYFGSFGAALRTLFDHMTQDSWSQVMRVCMYGCVNFGFNTGYAHYDGSCLSHDGSGRGVGYWAPIFYVVFEILSSMVLVSLLVGVIITSLELLREDLIEEELVMSKVKVVQRRYHLDSTQITLMLHLFERIDGNNNGSLLFEELVPILNAVKMNTSEQFEFFLRVDTDRSGQINFAEFCEMVSLMGLGHKTSQMASVQPRVRETLPKRVIDAVMSGAAEVMNEVAPQHSKAALSFKLRSVKERVKDRDIIDRNDDLASARSSTKSKSDIVARSQKVHPGPNFAKLTGDETSDELPGLLVNGYSLHSSKYPDSSKSLPESPHTGVRLFTLDDSTVHATHGGTSNQELEEDQMRVTQALYSVKLVSEDEKSDGAVRSSGRSIVSNQPIAPLSKIEPYLTNIPSLKSPYTKDFAPSPQDEDVQLADVV